MPTGRGQPVESSPLLLSSKHEPSALQQQKETTTDSSIHRNGSSSTTYHNKENEQIANLSIAQNQAEPKSFLSFSRQSKIVLIFCSTINFLESAAYALLGPFFPQAAEKKGMNLTLIGVVFSSFQLVIFLTSPFIGSYLTKLGAKFVFTCGVCVAGFCNILFGILTLGPNGWIFFVMCILTRSMMALGCAAFQTASFAIVSHQCKEAIGTTFAILETLSGIGHMVGPPLGGSLYSIGGFGPPFYIIGTLILLNGAIIYKYLPSQEVAENMQNKSFIELLGSPLILISISNLIVVVVGMSAYDSTFSTHLEDFNLQVIIISIIFVITPAAYTIFGPVWGYFTDTKHLHKSLTVFGLIIFSLTWFLAGPSTFLPFIPRELWVVVVSVLCLGLSFGAVYIPVMNCCLEGAAEIGFGSNLDTYAMVSGLFNSGAAIGGFLGPLGVSAMVQKWGYPFGYSVLGCISVFMALITATFLVYRRLVPNKVYHAGGIHPGRDKFEMFQYDEVICGKECG